jgi:hypothetical protein
VKNNRARYLLTTASALLQIIGRGMGTGYQEIRELVGGAPPTKFQQIPPLRLFRRFDCAHRRQCSLRQAQDKFAIDGDCHAPAVLLRLLPHLASRDAAASKSKAAGARNDKLCIPAPPTLRLRSGKAVLGIKFVKDECQLRSDFTVRQQF